MGQKTLINGTAYDVKSGKCLVNGTAYAIKKGRTRIDGTGYDIALESGTPLSDIPVGNTVKIAVNGTMRDWIVVNQGIPSGSALYDDSCNGTWLLMKDLQATIQYADPGDGPWFSGSYAYSYLNYNFLNLLEDNIKNIIKEVRIPHDDSLFGSHEIYSGANGLNCKVFCISAIEVGINYESYPIDGAKLDYFDVGNGTDASKKRIAYLAGTGTGWCTRSPRTSGTAYLWVVSNYGLLGLGDYKYSYGIRPAMILPFEALVADDGTVLA